MPVEPAAPAESKPRRRSTVREPIAFPSEGSAPATPEAAPAGPAAVEPAEVASAETGETGETVSVVEPAGSRRTGWWARRLIGGNKG
jgi:ribonuclease E